MLRNFIRAQRSWSEKTFGPGRRTRGLCEHIRKELAEIEQAPADLTEWVDVIILALDGAWRCGNTPLEIERAMLSKQALNFVRSWPKPGSEDDPMEHVRKS